MPDLVPPALVQTYREMVRGTGVEVTFARTVKGAHDPESATFAGPTYDIVTGRMVEVKGNGPLAWNARREGEDASVAAVTGLFVADVEGQEVENGARVQWRGVERSVLRKQDISPKGVTILTRVELT